MCWFIDEHSSSSVHRPCLRRESAWRLDSARQGDLAVLTVEDDGRGFEPGRPAESAKDGHVGLSLLGELASDLGGALRIESTPGEGCTMRLEVPWT